jgi:hypothetical protein
MQGPVVMASGVLYTEQDSLGGISREGSVSDPPRNAGAPLLAAAVQEDWIGSGAAVAATVATARFEGPTSHPLEDAVVATGEQDEALPADLEDEYEGARASTSALPCWPALLPMPHKHPSGRHRRPAAALKRPVLCCTLVHPCRGVRCQRLQ